jgi:hypothetical protein
MRLIPQRTMLVFEKHSSQFYWQMRIGQEWRGIKGQAWLFCRSFFERPPSHFGRLNVDLFDFFLALFQKVLTKAECAYRIVSACRLLVLFSARIAPSEPYMRRIRFPAKASRETLTLLLLHGCCISYELEI